MNSEEKKEVSPTGISEKRRPRLGCAALIERDNYVLLGRRAKDPHRGLWVIMGGGVEWLERMEDTVTREILEETSLTVTTLTMIGLHEIIEPEHDDHRLVVLYRAKTKGEPICGSDLAEVAWFSRAQLAMLKIAEGLTPTTVKILTEEEWLTNIDSAD